MEALKYGEAVKKWANDINHWFNMDATTDEVRQAMKVAYPMAIVSPFFRIDDGWREWLDTCEREGLADQIDKLRGKDPSLAYSDPGSFNRQ